MAVQKSRKTPSRRGMRRSHDALSPATLTVDETPLGSVIRSMLFLPFWALAHSVLDIQCIARIFCYINCKCIPRMIPGINATLTCYVSV